MKRGVLNKLVISLLLVVAGLAVYIYYSNKEEESVIRLDKDLISIYVGENKILNILPDDVSYYELTWKSDNDLIASVSNGIVRGNNVGNTIISLYSNGQLLDRCLVRVIDFDSEISAVDQETNSQIEVIHLIIIIITVIKIIRIITIIETTTMIIISIIIIRIILNQ